MLKNSVKGSKLIIIFILTVIVSGSILTYLSITHISNYKELLEKKISEEEIELTIRFSSDFENKMDSLITIFSNYSQSKHSQEIRNIKNFDSTRDFVSYIAMDSNGVYLRPNFIDNNPTQLQELHCDFVMFA